ncbi:mucin-5AC [Musca domestica]|uniref:Mucin-5AC n=1 Tax=Musca domestica TaxID=7370 RepID=A0ABM3UVC4_MUSDO|nr:mucin-5AC [Musca domestica]
MSRRQSLDRPGILSPPGPFLTPSPSPSISASPRLQPSPSLSPFPQDVLLVTGNPLANANTHEQERKAVTPGRRQSIHQFTNGSPNAGTVVFQPSPSQSPAAATSVIGITANAAGGLNLVGNFQNVATTTATTTGNDLNATLVGSNNIQLNKKGNKRQQHQQQQQQQHHQIFSSSNSHYTNSNATTTNTTNPPHPSSIAAAASSSVTSASSTTATIAGGYGQSHATTINNTPNTFATTNVACSPKNQTKKGVNATNPNSTATSSSSAVLPISQQQHQQFQQYHSGSPLIADSPSPSPSGTTITAASIKPPTPQPPTMQMLQQQFTIASNGNGGPGTGPQQTFQLIQGPQGQIIAAATSTPQHQQQARFTTTPTGNLTTTTTGGLTSATVLGNGKGNKLPQQILPKPLQQQQQQQILIDTQKHKQGNSAGPNPTPPPSQTVTSNPTSSSNLSQQQQQTSLTQISQSAQPGQQQIILPSGATASLTTTAGQQPQLLLNQVPMLVQQNAPQGVQLILRPPTPQLTATPSLVIQNARPQPQLQQQQPQQVLRILGHNGATMQLAAATPTFIVSSQANLIQQANHLQAIKTQPQNSAITQLSGLHAALSAAAAANQQPRSQQFTTTAATINGHLLGPSMAAQLQNLQLAAAAAANGNSFTAQIQMPNGLSASGAPTLLSQLPASTGTAQFQQNSAQGLINLNQLSNANIHLNQLSNAGATTFQTPAAPPSTNNAGGQLTTQNSAGNSNSNQTNTNDLYTTSLTQSSPAHVPVSVTPEPLNRQPTPVLQNMQSTASHQQQQQQQHHQQSVGGNGQIHLQFNAAATIQMQQQQQQQQQQQIQQLQQQIQQTQNQVQQAQQQAQALQQQHQVQQQQQQQQQQQPETKKKAKPRRRKAPATSAAANANSVVAASSAAPANAKPLTTTANKTLNTATSTTSVLVPAISTSNTTTKIVPMLSQQHSGNLTTVQTTVQQQQFQQNIIENKQPQQQQQQQRPKSPSPPPQIQRASNGKLDLGNVMKLCGITEDDDEDFMDTTPMEEPMPSTNQMTNPSTDYTISIPQPNGSGGNAAPSYTLSIPGVTSCQDQMDHSGAETAAANIVIKIDPSADLLGSSAATTAGPQGHPYSITIPRLPSQEEIQKQAQQHLQQVQNEAQQIKTSMSAASGGPTANITFTIPLTTAGSSSLAMSSSAAPPTITTSVAAVSTSATSTTNSTTTTATVKPRRKPAAKRNTKKSDNAASTAATVAVNNSTVTASSSITNSFNTLPTSNSSMVTLPSSQNSNLPSLNITTSSISTPLPTPSLVPSQIGNIQISQIDNRLAGQQGAATMVSTTPIGSLVENKIQIMPILDKSATNHQPQQTQIVFQPPSLTQNHPSLGNTNLPNTLTTNLNEQQQQPRQMQLVSLPQLSNSSVASNSSSVNLNMQAQPTLAVGQPSFNATLNPQNSTTTPTNVLVTSQTPMPQQQNQQQTAPPSNPALPGLTGNVSISVGTPNTIASLIPQLTGSLTLAVSEQCERLILRHDPNKPQDQQSQLILQALLKGALPNVTIINEPLKQMEQPQQQHRQIATNVIQQQQPAPTVVSTGPPSGNVKGSKKKQQQQQNVASEASKATGGGISKAQEPPTNSTTTVQPQLNMNVQTNVNSNPAPVPQQENIYLSLPKVDPATHQLFCLNSLTNQITPIEANQTTASIGPTERILIAPSGINAQQLAQCLQQGQIHFNDANPLPASSQIPQTNPAPPSLPNSSITLPVHPMNNAGSILSNSNATSLPQQAPKQQIVYPMTSISTTCSTAQSSSSTSTTTTITTTTTTTKQVANVAPIIDQSKAAKQDNKLAQGNSSTTTTTTTTTSTGAVPKKKPVRKPKASTTTAADVALMKNASVVKPLPKLDPLSQKPHNNPVQIVQPNTASGKPVVSTSTTSTTTSTSNVVSIQPFQTQISTGTKLVGITAPMQQQPQPQQQLQPTRTITTGGAPSLSQQNNNFSINFSLASIATSSSSQLTSGVNTYATATHSAGNTINTPSLTSSGMQMSLPTIQPIVSTGQNLQQQQQQQQPQHTVSRVQTIQLTQQQEQMLRQVQMQIQYLTVKMQHKNLISSMPLPADLDPSVVAAFNKPMTDIEINQSLQRLFMEQHRILSSGKEISTSDQFITNSVPPNSNLGTFNLMSNTNPPQSTNNDNKAALSGGSIPANVVQPNNHSTNTSGVGGSITTTPTLISQAGNMQQQQQTQKIHIYPIQHQQHQQQPQQPTHGSSKNAKAPKQQQQSSVVLNSNSKSNSSTTVTSTSTTVAPGPLLSHNNKSKQQQHSSTGSTLSTATTSNTTTSIATNSSGNSSLSSIPGGAAILQPSGNLTSSILSSPQLPQLSSLSSNSSLPTLPFASLPQPHMINITNMPAVLQQKHFTQHLQMQQQQLLQQQKIQIAKANTTSPAFASFQNTNTSGSLSTHVAGGGPPPLIFPCSSTVSSTMTTTITPQLTPLSQQHQFSTSPSLATNAFTINSLSGIGTAGITNQKSFILATSMGTPSLVPTATLSAPIVSATTSTTNVGATAPTFVINNHQQQQQSAITSSATNSCNTANTTVTASNMPTSMAITMSMSMSSMTSTSATLSLPQLVMTSGAATSVPPLVAASTTTAVATSPSSSMSCLHPVATIQPASGSTTITATSVVSTLANNNNMMVAPTNSIINGGLNIVGNPISQIATFIKTEDKVPSKAKLARLSLFLQQLEVDQQNCSKPDYKNPFQNKEEAVKRLIRYHCMYQNDEDIPSEEEEEFEKTAIRFQDKFRKLSGKFQQIILQESMLQHRTSEICQMEKLLIEDLRQEIADSKKLEQDLLKYEHECQQQQQQGPQQFDIKGGSLFDKLKNEIKTETQDSKPNLMDIPMNNDSNSNFCTNMQNTSSLDSIKNEIKTESMGNSSMAGGKSCNSSIDSFDLLKQSPINNNMGSSKSKSNEIKEPKKEECSNQWSDVSPTYVDSKNSNSFYNQQHQQHAQQKMPSNLFNGDMKKVMSATTPCSVLNNEETNDSFENFDIESEITPSFIMKKVEHKEEPQSNVNVTTSALTGSTSTATTTITSSANTVTIPSVNTSVSSKAKTKVNKINHAVDNTQPTNSLQTSSQATAHHQQQQQQQQQQQSIQDTSSNLNAQSILSNNFDFSQHLQTNHTANKQQQDDDWLCIQKELNLINTTSSTNDNVNNEPKRNNDNNHNKTLGFLGHESSEGIFQQQQQRQTQVSNDTTTNCNVPSVLASANNTTSAPTASSCSQQPQQAPELSLNHAEESHQADLNEFFSGSEDSEVHKAVETRLESMFGESPVHLSGSKDHVDSPYNLEIMGYGESGKSSTTKLFGNSPVHLGASSGPKDRIDSPYMSMLFGEAAKSPAASSANCNTVTKGTDKTNWDSDFTDNSFLSTGQNVGSSFASNATNSMTHHIQLGSANNPRWMQNMEAQFPVFPNTNSSTMGDCLGNRKRQWNGHMVDDTHTPLQQQQHGENSPQKKICGSITDSSTSAHSPLNIHQQQQQSSQQQQQQHHHNLVPNDTAHAQDLMDAALLSLHDGLGVDNATPSSQTNGYNHHMIMNPTGFDSFNQMDAQQQQNLQQNHFMNVNQTQQQQQMMLNHHNNTGHHDHSHHQHQNSPPPTTGGGGEFDDDITRHVQNAIDSILNLQNSEADSLSFSLDHTMGVLLGNSMMQDQQSANNTGHDSTKRQQLVDELGDCIMGSGAGGGNSSTDASNLTESHLLMDHNPHTHHPQLMQQQQQHVLGGAGNHQQHSHHQPLVSATAGNNPSQQQQAQLNDFNCVVSGNSNVSS